MRARGILQRRTDTVELADDGSAQKLVAAHVVNVVKVERRSDLAGALGAELNDVVQEG